MSVEKKDIIDYITEENGKKVLISILLWSLALASCIVSHKSISNNYNQAYFCL